MEVDEPSRRNMREHGRFFLTHADDSSFKGAWKGKGKTRLARALLLLSQIHIWRGLEGPWMTGGEFSLTATNHDTTLFIIIIAWRNGVSWDFGNFGKVFPLLFKRSEATEIVWAGWYLLEGWGWENSRKALHAKTFENTFNKLPTFIFSHFCSHFHVCDMTWQSYTTLMKVVLGGDSTVKFSSTVSYALYYTENNDILKQPFLPTALDEWGLSSTSRFEAHCTAFRLGMRNFLRSLSMRYIAYPHTFRWRFAQWIVERILRAANLTKTGGNNVFY